MVGTVTDKGQGSPARYSARTDQSEQGSRGSLSAVVEFDDRIRICGWDKAAETIFGYTEDQARGRELSFIVPARNIRRLVEERIRDDLGRGGMFKSIGIPSVDAKGNRLYFNATWLLSRNKIGMSVGEKAIITRVPDTEKIFDSPSHAKRLDAITKMSARAVHELKNPLASIRLNIEAIEGEIRQWTDAGDTGGLIDQISSVMKELDRLERLAQGYLQWVHVPRMKLTMRSLPQMLLGLQEFLQKEMQSKKIRFANDFCMDCPGLLFDEDRMREAVLNLYVNAADTMPEGGEIRTHVCTNDEWVDIHIYDTGPGISANDIENIFEPFFTRKECGTGLGLPIARDILDAHGGTLKVSPDAEGGAHFILRLPLAP